MASPDDRGQPLGARVLQFLDHDDRARSFVLGGATQLHDQLGALGLEVTGARDADLRADVATHRPGKDPSRWMFEVAAGQPPHQNTVGHQWRQACARAGVSG